MKVLKPWNLMLVFMFLLFIPYLALQPESLKDRLLWFLGFMLVELICGLFSIAFLVVEMMHDGVKLLQSQGKTHFKLEELVAAVKSHPKWADK